MAKCPYCGEPVRRGQDRCFACGHRFGEGIVRRRKKPANPVVFIAAGAGLLVGIVGLLILLPKQGQVTKVKTEKAELGRVRDSVRKANIEQRTASRSDRQIDRLNREMDDLEFRFERVHNQTAGDKPTPEQQRLAGRIKSETSRLRSMIARMTGATEEERDQMADSVRVGERRVRALISDFGRAPKNR